MISSRNPVDIGPVVGSAAFRYIASCDYEENAEYKIFAEELRGICLDLVDKHVTILDVGCGPGTLCGVLKHIFPKATLLGIDLSRDMINYASARYPDVRFLVGRAENIPTRSNTVDLVVSLNTLHHLEKTDPVFEEIFRVLRPNGTAYLSDLYRDVSRSHVDQKLERMHQAIATDLRDSIATSFTQEELSRSLVRSGINSFWIKKAQECQNFPLLFGRDPFHHELDLPLYLRLFFRKRLV